MTYGSVALMKQEMQNKRQIDSMIKKNSRKKSKAAKVARKKNRRR